jgi:hypothetical protein
MDDRTPAAAVRCRASDARVPRPWASRSVPLPSAKACFFPQQCSLQSLPTGASAAARDSVAQRNVKSPADAVPGGAPPHVTFCDCIPHARAR